MKLRATITYTEVKTLPAGGKSLTPISLREIEEIAKREAVSVVVEGAAGVGPEMSWDQHKRLPSSTNSYDGPMRSFPDSAFRV